MPNVRCFLIISTEVSSYYSWYIIYFFWSQILNKISPMLANIWEGSERAYFLVSLKEQEYLQNNFP